MFEKLVRGGLALNRARPQCLGALGACCRCRWTRRFSEVSPSEHLSEMVESFGASRLSTCQKRTAAFLAFPSGPSSAEGCIITGTGIK